MPDINNNMPEDRRKEELRNLREALTEFMLVEIGGNALDGITYTLLSNNNENDVKSIQRYNKIKEKAMSLGFSDTQLFRVYKMSNGYIFDMDLDEVKTMTTKIAKHLAKTDPTIRDTMNLIGNHPEERRKRDMVALAKYVYNRFNEGHRDIEVALFSRNSTNKITITGKANDGSYCQIQYNACALRHWDIEIINEKLLRPKGILIRSLQFYEILPSKTGVSVRLGLEMAPD